LRTSGLILDFGEVLSRPQRGESVKRLAALAGLPVDEFRSRYWQHRAAYDGGLPVSDYWRRVLECDDEVPRDLLAQLIAVDAFSWRDYREDVWDIAAAFRARGGRTAMLSNGVPEIIATIRAKRRLEAWFDVVVVSCEVGCCKPDPAIYKTCLEQLDTPAARTLFVDDRSENIRAAEAIGLQTLEFAGDESVRALRELLDL
jgi:putative hydrolase of the HAD superfamily